MIYLNWYLQKRRQIHSRLQSRCSVCTKMNRSVYTVISKTQLVIGNPYDPLAEELVTQFLTLFVSLQEFEDFEKLDEVLACFCEALRMFRELKSLCRRCVVS